MSLVYHFALDWLYHHDAENQKSPTSPAIRRMYSTWPILPKFCPKFEVCPVEGHNQRFESDLAMVETPMTALIQHILK